MQSAQLCEVQNYTKWQIMQNEKSFGYFTKYLKSEIICSKISQFDADEDLHLVWLLFFCFIYLFVSAYQSMFNQLLLIEDD